MSILDTFKQAASRVFQRIGQFQDRQRQSSRQAQTRRQEFLAQQARPEVKQNQKEQITKFLSGEFGIQKLASQSQEAANSYQRLQKLKIASQSAPTSEAKLAVRTQAKEELKHLTTLGMEFGLNIAGGGPQKIPSLSKKALTTKAIINEAIRPASERIVKTEQALLRDRLRQQVKGANAGAAWATKTTKAELLNKFRTDQSHLKEIQQGVVNFAKQHLPQEQIGKYLDDLPKVRTRLGAFRVMNKIDTAIEQNLRRGYLDDIKTLYTPQTKTVPGKYPKIDLETQKKIQDLAKITTSKRLSPTTRNKLVQLKNYIQTNGVPTNISPAKLKELDRLTKLNVKDLSTEELSALSSKVSQMVKEGATKARLLADRAEREFTGELKTLTSGTGRMLGGKTTFGGAAKKPTLLDGINNTLTTTRHTFRTAEILDNFAGYRGPNAKLVRTLSQAENNAVFEHREAVMNAIDEIRQISPRITPEMEDRISIAFRMQEGPEGVAAAKRIMDAKGISEIPILTPQERIIGEIVRKAYRATEDRYGKIYESINGVPFRKLENHWLPLKYTGEVSDPIKSIHPSYNRRNLTGGKYAESRIQNTKIPRTDFINILHEGLRDRLWYTNLQEPIKKIDRLISTPEYLSKAGQPGVAWWKDLLGYTASGGSENLNYFEQGLKQLRLNTSEALISGRLSTALLQPTAVIDAMSAAQSMYGPRAAAEVMKEVTKTWLNPLYANRLINSSKALSTRNTGELALEDVTNRLAAKKGVLGPARKGIGNALLYPLKRADLTTAAGTREAFKRIAKRYGDDDPEAAADFLMNIVSGTSGITMRPPVLRKELGKTMFALQSFALNRFGLQAEEFSRLVRSPGFTKKMNAALGLMILGTAGLAEDFVRDTARQVLGGDPSDPKKKKNPVGKYLMSYIRNVPLFGDTAYALWDSKGFAPEMNLPLLETANKIFRGAGQRLGGKTRETRVKGFFTGVEGIAGLMGVPGSGQFFQFLRDQIDIPEKKTPVNSTYDAKDIFKKPYGGSSYTKDLFKKPY